MDDTLNTFPDRDTDCTSRSLATLLVAWVGAAMVASVLLRWKYMWIALAILTLLFLIACGYAACNARSAHQRIACRTDRPIVRRRSIENVQTVSRIVDGNYVVDPPAYQTFWITDLPPSYSAVIRAQPPNYHLTSVDEFAIGPRLSNPPPYTMVIQSDVLNTSNGQPTNRTQEAHLSSFPAGINQQSRGEPWPLDTFPHNNNNNNINNNNNDINSNNNNNSNIIVRRQSFSEISQINEDKEPKERRRSRSIGTHYFSNIIINCTFSRNERRTNDENINHTPTIEQRVDSNQNHSSSTNDNSESKI